MAARKEIWDLMAEGGPVKVEMFSVDADEAVKNDPGRWSHFPPDGTIEAEVAAKVRDEDAQRNRANAEAEEKVRAADQEAMAAKRKLRDEEAQRKKDDAAKKKDESEKNGLSVEARERQIDETARQKGDRARQEAAVATGDVKVDAAGQSLRGIPANGMTTESLPGPVPFRGEQGLDNQIPASPTPPERQDLPRADPMPVEESKPDTIPAKDIKAVEVKK